MREIIAGSIQDKKDLLVIVAKLREQPLFVNAGYLMGVDVVNSLAGFLFWWIATRLYRAEDVGLASAILVAVTLISSIAGAGIGFGVVRFLPDSSHPHRLLNTLFIFSEVMALLVAGIYLVGLSFWSPSLIILRQHGAYIVGFLAYSVATTLMSVATMVFVARRQTVYILIHASIVSVVRLFLVVSLMGLSVAGLVGAIALATILAVALSLLGFLPRVEPGYRPRLEISRQDLMTILPYSLGNYVADLLMQVSQRVLPLMILEILGPTANGYAYIAWMLGNILVSPGIALMGSAFAEGSNSPHHLTTILFKSIATGLGLTVPISLIVGIAAPWFLWPFGANYAEAATGLLRWLAAAAPMVVLAWLYFIYLRVQKRIGRLILLSNIDAIVTIGVAVLLIPRLGIAGSGISWLVGNSIVVVIAIMEMVKAGKLKEIEPMLNQVFALKLR